MQVCFYDVFYIDLEIKMVVKCNYCVYWIDVGLELVCVNVCLEYVIIFGDMDNLEIEIVQLLVCQQVLVRKVEKGMYFNFFYIDVD